MGFAEFIIGPAERQDPLALPILHPAHSRASQWQFMLPHAALFV
jgi:hypothetical protein